MKLDFNYDGKTKLKDWWGKVKANFQTVQDEFNEHRENTTLDHPDKSVKQQHIDDKAVGTGQIADYAVGQTQLQQYAVSSAKIYPGAVKTTHLADGNVTKAKLSEDVQQQIDKVTEVQEALTQEISDRQAGDNLLDEKISAVQSIEGYRNRCLDITVYEDSEAVLITDDNGNKYLSYNVTFDDGSYYKHMYMTIDKFTKPIVYPSKISIKFDMFSQHLALEGCESGQFQIGESGIVVYFADGTQTRYGRDNVNYTDGGTKEIMRNGKPEIYNYGECEYTFETEKEITKIVFDMVADNFYIDGSEHGACEENILISNVECLDDESAATVGEIRQVEDTAKLDKEVIQNDIEELQTADKNIKSDISLIMSPINHRNIFRGKNLGSAVTEGQKTAIQSGTFDDLFVGDYWAIDGVNWRIVDMDYWAQGKDYNFAHHLVIMPDTSLYISPMNSNGTEGGFLGSSMYTAGLQNAKTLINRLFGDMLFSYADIFSNEVTEDVVSERQTEVCTVTIPNERMIFGTQNIEKFNLKNTVMDGYDFITFSSQLSLFRIYHEIPSAGPCYWLRDVYDANSYGIVDPSTRALGAATADYPSHGVRPVFAIG